MSDSVFFTNYTQATSLIKSIRHDLQVSQDKKNKGLNVALNNQAIKEQLNKLQKIIENLEDNVKQDRKERLDISPQELSNRIRTIARLKSDYNSLDQKLKDLMGVSRPSVGYKPPSPMIVVDNGKREDVTVAELRANMEKNEIIFNEKIEVLSDATNVLKKKQLEMKDGLDDQNKLLDKIQDNVDDNTVMFIKRNRKLLKILKKGSDCCLWVAIIILAAVLVLLIVY